MLNITFTRPQRSALSSQPGIEERGSKFSLNFPNLNEQPTFWICTSSTKTIWYKMKITPPWQIWFDIEWILFRNYEHTYRRGAENRRGIIISPIVTANSYKIGRYLDSYCEHGKNAIILLILQQHGISQGVPLMDLSFVFLWWMMLLV